jgi:tetratricopeptide (TPR) repeat protein
MLGFLAKDPANCRLIESCANSAFEARDFEQCEALLQRYEAVEPLPPHLLNLRGLCGLHLRDYSNAAKQFTAIVSAGQGDASVRFNLAYALALDGQYDAALAALELVDVTQMPDAAALKVRCLHHLGRLEEAITVGDAMLQSGNPDPELPAALSVVALDLNDLQLARRYAQMAPNALEATTTLGVLALDSEDPRSAQLLFERALQFKPDSGRAWLGQGLSQLAQQDGRSAAASIDRGAALLKTHLGSWIAAGWAHFVVGDLPVAQQRFETALNLDPRFAESHGSLAVVSIAQGRLQEAERQSERALRLDRQCLSGALARSLLLALKGDQAAAMRIRETALNTPIGPGGKTIAQEIARLGMQRGGKA